MQLTFKEHFIISFSGGIGSAAFALLALEHDLDFECVFADTLIEDEDLHRFNAEIERVIGKPIIRLSARPFLRKNIDGVTNYLRLSEFRELAQSGKITVEDFEFGGCACFVDEVDSS